MSRGEFVSGLPFTSARPRVFGDPRGLQLLGLIRERAKTDIKALDPLCVSRFTGDERLPADPEAVRVRGEYEAIAALCDVISSDPALLARVSTMLALKVRP